MLAIFGALAITFCLGYIILSLGFMAMCCFLGFDEVNIPVGLLLCIPIAGCMLLWWWSVGSHINVNFN